MADTLQVRADVLKAMMAEDRKEVRGIRSAIYNVTYVLTLFSFALSAFVIDKSDKMAAFRVRALSVWIDGLIILAIMASFWKLKADLLHARQCLKLRQDAINGLLKDPPSFQDPFGDARHVKLDIEDTELIWQPIAGALAVLVKAIAMRSVLGG